jgi:hypothetical protein
MKSRLTIAMLSACIGVSALAAQQAAPQAGVPAYEVVAGWLKIPEWRKETRGWDSTNEIGSMHGDVAVSSTGDVYVSVEGTARQRFASNGPGPGLQVYDANGKFVRNVPNAPYDFHGFVIHRDPGGEFIYGARLGNGTTAEYLARIADQVVVKMSLEGKVVLAIPASSIPDQFKNKTEDGRPYTRLTHATVAPNGDIYVADGYSTSFIHRFDRAGKYIKSFGGSAQPYGFRTLHKLAVDTRFTPARLIACDRANNRIVHLTLDGDLIGVVATDIVLPAAIAVNGDLAAIASLRGQVYLLDKAGKVISTLGVNTVADEVQNNATDPSKWRPGIFTAPHGVAFSSRGDLLVSEFNLYGRVHRFNVSTSHMTSGGR